MDSAALKEKLSGGAADGVLSRLYGSNISRAAARCRNLVNRFVEAFGDRDGLRVFSAPGRTEIGGNHTDHNRGKVLAAAVRLDILAVAARTDERIIRVRSDGHTENVIDLNDLSPCPAETGSSNALIRGVAAYFASSGRTVGGFDAVTVSDVPPGSGLSSSAAFEVLIAVILDHLYGKGDMPPLEMAKAGSYAENVHFGKPSGLMDQTVSAHGGLVCVDFGADPPAVRSVNCGFAGFDHSICIVGPIGSHADLTDAYAAIPFEMRAVAAALKAEVLGDAREKEFMESLPELCERLPERAVLRALHFFAENRRVLLQAKALERGDYKEFLGLVRDSGHSSFMYLQNVTHGSEQRLALALALAETLLQGSGAVRVHGGGFAGTIQAFVPFNKLSAFEEGMGRVFGSGICRVAEFRQFGGVAVL
jgi:galactokinase